MKIAHISVVPVADNYGGGITVCNNLSSLAELADHLTIAAPSFDMEFIDWLRQRFSACHIELVTLKKDIGSLFHFGCFSNYAHSALTAAEYEQYDAIFVEGTKLGGLVKKVAESDVPVIVNQHNYEPIFVSDKYVGFVYRLLFQLVLALYLVRSELWAYRYSTHFMFVSFRDLACVHELLNKKKLFEKRSEKEVYHPISEAVRKPPSENAKKNKPLYDILITGDFSCQRTFSIIQEVMTTLDEEKVIVAGRNADVFEETDCCEIVDAPSNAEMEELHNASKFLLNINHGFGGVKVKVLSALQRQQNVINLGGLPIGYELQDGIIASTKTGIRSKISATKDDIKIHTRFSKESARQRVRKILTGNEGSNGKSAAYTK